PQVPVELSLGADVDTSRRIVEHDHVGSHRETATDQNLLLVAAGQRGDAVFLDAELDEQVVRFAPKGRLESFPIDEAEKSCAPLLTVERNDHVLEDRQGREYPLTLSVARDIGHAPGNGFGEVADWRP